MALVASSARSGILSIPWDLKLEIFNYLLHDDIFGRTYLHSDVSSGSIEWSGYSRERSPLSLLRVCRQLSAEFVSVVYKSVVIGDSDLEFGMWQDFFRTIGPTNASHIQDIRIYYHCREEPSSSLDWYGCPYQWTSADLWVSLLEEMYVAGVRPKRIHVDVTCCEYCCAAPPSTQPDYEHFGGSLIQYELPHESCETYTNLDFLRSLSYLLGRVERIAFTGEFNPLWPSALKARFGLQTACRGHHAFQPRYSYLGDYKTHFGDHWVMEKP
ncbi:hypothetical protein F4820DRAFT_442332 [Hypoxylon rubiginosum]|uniref:Uncharacterized protein n=1 Tax=Hypoxylon rubiginosum TaxID=110542 RepID=A0ACB9YI21_9PEZI|nr:hypothetical protein F4820DRAFT_442332 [Hypoxylon rubiginosum]